MRPNEAFTEDRYWVPVDVKAVSQLKDVVLENIDDTFSKLVCIPLSALYKSLQNSIEPVLIWFLIRAQLESQVAHDAVKFWDWHVLFKVADDEIVSNHGGDTDDVLFLPLLVGKLIKNFWNFHEHEFLKLDVCQGGLLVKSLFATIMNERHVQILDWGSQASDATKVETAAFLGVLVVPELFNLGRKLIVSSALFNTIEKFVEALSIEKFLQLLVENFKLWFEILVVVSMSDPVYQLLASFQITWLSAPVEFILQPMFDLRFQVLWNIIPMSNITDPCHWDCAHELICKTWKLYLD